MWTQLTWAIWPFGPSATQSLGPYAPTHLSLVAAVMFVRHRWFNNAMSRVIAIKRLWTSLDYSGLLWAIPRLVSDQMGSDLASVLGWHTFGLKWESRLTTNKFILHNIRFSQTFHNINIKYSIKVIHNKLSEAQLSSPSFPSFAVL